VETETIAPTLTQPVADDVLPAVLDVIRDRGLKVGDQLPSIRELAELLEVKPTAVRDALLRAQALGLVRVLPRAGAFLRSSLHGPGKRVPTAPEALAGALLPGSPQETPNLFHLLDARRLVEVELAGRAAERRRLEDLLPVRNALEAMAAIPVSKRHHGDYADHDIRFHVEISRLAGNLVLANFQQALLEMLRPHLVALPWDAARQNRTDLSHAAIYAALVAGDSARARAEMLEHLSMAYNSLLQDIQTPPAAGRASAR
jgi:GntR family transcriptional regulator, transcriptional repressor for pyruvate dehydrogenase complex